MQKRPWFQSLKVVSLALAVLGSGGACSRNTLYETEDPGSYGQPTRTIEASPAAYQSVQVTSQA